MNSVTIASAVIVAVGTLFDIIGLDCINSGHLFFASQYIPMPDYNHLTSHRVHGSRRRFIKASLLSLPTAVAAPAVIGTARAATAPRDLKFYHTHTGEKLSVEYHDVKEQVSGALQEVNQFLRDFRTGEVHPIDPGLLVLLCDLKDKTGCSGRYEVISGYRSPKTNAQLRNNSSGVAKKSLHMKGKAIDIRLTGFDTKKLQEASKTLAMGGVGYYQKSDFVHVDTGRVRFW